MKIVTNDYGCGTSSSILDYGIKDVIVVSENDWEKVFQQDDDLFLVGHDFLFYMWDDERKIQNWIRFAEKHEVWLWCFERIDAIVPQWMQKSHVSLSVAQKFCKRILACDEDDCDKYGLDWLPQWASKKFYDYKDVKPTTNKILFSGQAGSPEYQMRNNLLDSISNDSYLSEKIEITNKKRSLTWEKYVENFLKYKFVLNPVGIVKALNTRAYEALYSGRILLQHTIGNYRRHVKLLKDYPSAIFFENIDIIKNNVNDDIKIYSDEIYTNNSLYARMKSIGIDVK